MVLLVGFMLLLGIIFAFVNVGDTVKEQFEPKEVQEPVNNTQSNQTPLKGNGLIQQSINGLKALFKDVKTGIQIFNSDKS